MYFSPCDFGLLLALSSLTPLPQLHNVEEQVNLGVPLGIILDEFSMIPPKMLGQVLAMALLHINDSGLQ